MANIKVSELNEATSLNNSDVFMVVQNNESKKANLSAVLNKTFYKDEMSFDNYSNLVTLAQDIYANKDKQCIGGIGTLHDTNLKTLLGDPNIGNYTSCVFEWLNGNASYEGCIKATAYAPYTSNIKIGYIIYDTVGDTTSARFTGWERPVAQEYLGNNPNINELHYKCGIYGLYGSTITPNTGIGVLEVLIYSQDWVIQRFTTVEATPRMWERTYTGGTTWNSWIQRW